MVLCNVLCAMSEEVGRQHLLVYANLQIVWYKYVNDAIYRLPCMDEKHSVYSGWLCTTSRPIGFREMWFADCSCTVKTEQMQPYSVDTARLGLNGKLYNSMCTAIEWFLRKA